MEYSNFNRSASWGALFIGCVLTIGTVHASETPDCECDTNGDGTLDAMAQYDCDGDGVNEACHPCGTPCKDGNEASEGMECCGGTDDGTEFDPDDQCCNDDDEVIDKAHEIGSPEDKAQDATDLKELSDRSVSEETIIVNGNPFIGYLYNYYVYEADETDRTTTRKIEKITEDPRISNCGGSLSGQEYNDANYSYSFNPSISHSGISLSFTVTYEPAKIAHNIAEVPAAGDYEKIYQDIFKTSKKGKSSYMKDQKVTYDQYHGSLQYPSRSGNHLNGPTTTTYNDKSVTHDSSYEVTNYEGVEDIVGCCPGT